METEEGMNRGMNEDLPKKNWQGQGKEKQKKKGKTYPIIRMIFKLFLIYLLYIILYDTTMLIFYSPTIISETELCNMINNNTSNEISKVFIDRVKKVAEIMINNNLTGISSKYKLVLSDRNDTLDFIFQKTSNTTYNIEYFDGTDNFWEIFPIKGIALYYVLFLIIKYILSNYVKINTPQSNILGNITDIDMTMPANVETKFDDIVGLYEAKEQIKKYVDIMKNRNKYKIIGAKIPKGILLSGAPGCGKTLLAKAVAGEANVKFIAVTGSDFDELFVGVGASRVKKLFKSAREASPCIIFIDEIDSIGEKREGYKRGGTDTLNKILSEMDGFKENDSIMVIASTNRASSLDSALIRSGRFDAKITIDPPTKKDRIEMFRLYLDKIVCDQNIIDNFDTFIEQFANMAPRATGADIANICNQAAVNASYNNRNGVTFEDIAGSIDNVLIGLEKPTKKSSDEEQLVTAYHEAGHALIGFILKDAMNPLKISIIPRGHGIAGYTLPQEIDSSTMSSKQMIAEIYVLLAGRCAEMIKFHNTTAGASNDFEKANKIIKNMITKYGMCKTFGPTVYDYDSSDSKLSETKRHQIEDLIEKELNYMYQEVETLLRHHQDQLDKLAMNVYKNEVIILSDIRELLPELENTIETMAFSRYDNDKW